jgi:hypothetical protein
MLEGVDVGGSLATTRRVPAAKRSGDSVVLHLNATPYGGGVAEANSASSAERRWRALLARCRSSAATSK